MRGYYLFIVFIFLSSKIIFSQESKIFDEGYKDFKWGLSVNNIKSLVDNTFQLKESGWPESYLVTDTDKKSNLEYFKREDRVEYTYIFNFFNDALYEIRLKVYTREEKNVPFVKELEQSFLKDLINFYGKPKKEILYSYWFGKKVDIEEQDIGRGMNFLGEYVTTEYGFNLKIAVKNKNKEIEKLMDAFKAEKGNKESKDARNKANSIRKKF